MSLPPDTYSHVLADKPLSEETRQALVALVEVAYEAHKRGILPNESHYPKRKPKMNQRIKNKLAKAQIIKNINHGIKQRGLERMVEDTSQFGPWQPLPISYSPSGYNGFNGRFA